MAYSGNLLRAEDNYESHRLVLEWLGYKPSPAMNNSFRYVSPRFGEILDPDDMNEIWVFQILVPRLFNSVLDKVVITPGDLTVEVELVGSARPVKVTDISLSFAIVRAAANLIEGTV